MLTVQTRKKKKKKNHERQVYFLGVGGMMRMVLLSLAACAYGLPSGKPNALLAKSDGHTSWEDSAPGGGGMTAFTL